MKKLIAILLLFIGSSLFVSKGQSINTSLKDTVTINVIAKNDKQSSSITSLNSSLLEIVNSQTVTYNSLIGAFNDLSSEVNAITREVEIRNKSDGKNFVTNYFNYSQEDVKHKIRLDRWLNFTSLCIGFIYIFVFFWNGSYSQGTASTLFFKAFFHIFAGILLYLFVLKTLTIIFNGDYYVIKELIKLYS